MMYAGMKVLGLDMEGFWRMTPGVFNDLLAEAAGVKKPKGKKRTVKVASAEEIPGM